jgi:hypothetical protein
VKEFVLKLDLRILPCNCNCQDSPAVSKGPPHFPLSRSNMNENKSGAIVPVNPAVIIPVELNDDHYYFIVIN